jgi:hypothetical protein
VPDVLDHPAPLATLVASPFQQLLEPLTPSSDHPLRDLHPKPVHRDRRVRLLVRIDPNRQHPTVPSLENRSGLPGGQFSVGAMPRSYQVTPGNP